MLRVKGVMEWEVGRCGRVLYAGRTELLDTGAGKAEGGTESGFVFAEW